VYTDLGALHCQGGAAVTQTTGEPTIRIGVHPNLNRLPRGATKAERSADKARLCSTSANGMTPADLTLAQLGDLLDAGRGFAAYMTDGHRCNDSARAQHIVLDDDIGDPEFEPKVRALNCAALVGGTVTIGHNCAVVPLAEPISDPQLYRELVIRVNYRLGAVVDPAGNVISQPRLGFRSGTTRVIAGEFLTIAEIMSWSAPPAPKPTFQPREFSHASSGLDHFQEYERFVQQAAEQAFTRRYGKQSKCLNPNHPDKHPSARIAEGKNGLMYFCNCGTYKMTTVAKWLGLPGYRAWVKERYPEEHQRPPTRIAIPLELPKLDAADITFHAQWISDADPLLPRRGVVCVIGDKGTGKSTWAKAVKEDFGEALVITPLINLTRAAAEHYGLELYEGLTASQRLQTAHSLAITLNSIERFASVTGRPLPRPRLLILDELSKMLAALRAKKLFKRGAATRVFSILGELIRSAELVIVTDADLGQEEIEWLRSLRADVTVAVNTYVRPYGEMEVLPGDQNGLDAMRTEILEALGANRGTVFVTSTSKKEIEALGAAAQVNYHVLTIHAGNSTNIEQRGFIQHPQINLYEGVFVSPSYATGGNIPERVYRTFGIFRSDEIDAALCLQMLARARDPEKTVVWIEAKEQKRPIRWETIYNHVRQKAEGTDKLCVLNSDGFLDFDGIQKDLLTLQSKLLARRNRSTNDLRADFLARAARNYTITLVEGELPTEGAQAVVQARQDIKERWNEAVLTVAPISPEEHQRRSGRGIRTEDDNAGLERYLIEHFYKQPITPELFDFDASGKGRDRLRLFMDVFNTSEARLKELDILEAHDRTPLLNRAHYAQRQRTIRRVLLAMWGSRAACTPETELCITDINTRMTGFSEQHAGAFYLYCGGRADHSQEPLKVLQRALHLIGLNLEEIRTRNKDAPKRYRLGREAWARMNARAQTRLEGLEQEAAERETAAWGALQKNVEKVFTREASPALPPTARPVEPLAEWRPRFYDPALLAPNNPFSKPAAEYAAQKVGISHEQT
jgi:hypothetical protein